MEVGALRHLITTSTRIQKINMLPLLSKQFNFKPKCIPLIVVGGGCTGMGINMSEKNHNPCNLFDNKFELHVIADNICTYRQSSLDLARSGDLKIHEEHLLSTINYCT